MIGALAEHVINPVDLEMPFFGQSVLSHHLSYGYVHETSVLPMFSELIRRYCLLSRFGGVSHCLQHEPDER